MKNKYFRMTLCFFIILSTSVSGTVAAKSDKPSTQPLNVPFLNFTDSSSPFPTWGIFSVSSIAYDAAWKKVYVGVGSYDNERRNLLVYDVAADGSLSALPRRYADYNVAHTGRYWDRVNCIVLDKKHRRLFMGIGSTEPKFTNSLAMYSLTGQGEPEGKVETFSAAHPEAQFAGIVLNPKMNRMYLAGWWASGFEAIDLDDSGRPTGKAYAYEAGSGPKQSIGINQDGTKLYLGAYPWTLEVCNLDLSGNPVGQTREYPIAGGPKEYLTFVVGNRAIYFRSPKNTFGYFSLDTDGEPVGEPASVDTLPSQGICACGQDRVAVAVSTTFSDALTGELKTDGVRVQEYLVNPSGAPATLVRETKPYLRQKTIVFSAYQAPAMVTQSLGSGFLGNRFAGLNLRVTLVDFTTKNNPPCIARTVKMADSFGIKNFAYSSKRNAVYALDAGKITVWSANNPAGPVMSIPLADTGTALALDDNLGVLYISLADNSIVALELGKDGVPIIPGETIATSIKPIAALVVNPETHNVYVLGPGEKAGHVADATTSAAKRIIQLPAYLHMMKGVVDPVRGRLYAVSGFCNKNLWIWHLSADGSVPDVTPHLFIDGFPKQQGMRSVVTDMHLDAGRNKIYLCGRMESSPDKGWLSVYTLDANGDPAGAPRVYPSLTVPGAVQSIAMSGDGSQLYETRMNNRSFFALHLDKNGEPTGREQSWQMQNYFLPDNLNSKISLTHDGSQLLVSEGNSLQIIKLSRAGKPLQGLYGKFTAGSQQADMGFLVPGIPSDWISLDTGLKDGTGLSFSELALSGAEVTKAVITYETALFEKGRIKPLATVTGTISGNGNVEKILLPRYGTDDVAHLSSMVQTQGMRSQLYLDFAKACALKPDEKPRQFIVANYSLGFDTDETAFDRQVHALSLLGTNTLHLLGYLGFSPELIRTTAAKYGITRFGIPNQGEPAYFDFDLKVPDPGDEKIRAWAQGVNGFAKTLGVTGKEIVLLSLSDEPGWVFPEITSYLKEKPERIAAFRDYLKKNKLTPEFFGKTSWDTVAPVSFDASQKLPDKRLLVWTGKFLSESNCQALAVTTAALRREVNPFVATTANCNNFLSSCLWRSALNQARGGGAPDWFELARDKSVTHLWTEDWTGDSNAMIWSAYADAMRCAAREGGLSFGGDIIGQSTGQFEDGGKYKIMSLFGHGGKAVDFYAFGPTPPSPDGWSDRPYVYRAIASGVKMLGKAEELLYPGRPRNGTVAILIPNGSQVWDTSDAGNRTKLYWQEIYGLHAALIHTNYPVDFVDEKILEQGGLEKYGYKALYITGPNLSVKAQNSVIEWVKNGGTLGLLPGAAAADEYDEPADVLTSATGASPTALTRGSYPFSNEFAAIPFTKIEIADTSAGLLDDATQMQTMPLVHLEGKALARFSDGSAAIMETTAAAGRIVSYGYWPGCTYWASPDRCPARSIRQRLPRNWSVSSRLAAILPARIANAKKYVEVSAPCVEAALLESEKGIAITLLNWTGNPLPQITVKVPDLDTVKISNVKSVEQGNLQYRINGGILSVTLPLATVDVLMIYF
jgi:hypothetical protein